MRLPCVLQPRILKEAIKSFIKGPYTSKFPFKPHIPEEGFRGAPKFCKDECIGCSACAQVCPPEAITFKDVVENGKAIRRFVLRYDICIFCGQCEANCPTTKGIRLGNEFDLATISSREELKDKVEKTLVLCEDCNDIIAPYEQIIWVAEKLGPICFSNTSVLLLYLDSKSLISPGIIPAKTGVPISDKIISKKEADVIKSEFSGRPERIKILCPKCRRSAVLKS